MLCKDCKFCMTQKLGLVSAIYLCKILPKGKRGVYPWKTTVNPRCPLKENKKLKKGINVSTKQVEW